VLRRAGLADLDLAVELMREFYGESGFTLHEERGREALRGLVADPVLGRLWLVEDAGAVAGYVALTFGWSIEYQGRDAFVDDLYLRRDFRGRGLGTRVMEQVEAEARALGVQALHLEVARDNQAGQALYFRRGFRANDRQLLSKRL
jgi:ribosomal protein S18 acetylase RimI-like enzyme